MSELVDKQAVLETIREMPFIGLGEKEALLDAVKGLPAIEIMEQYKIVDTEKVYTNGTELVPIFRIKQWEDAHRQKKGIWTTHEVACLLAEATGDECACNVNGNDEWLPFECIFAQRECPNVGVACWEQWLVHRGEKHNETN